MPIHELPIDDKIAIVFGTEMEGLTDVAIEQADERVYIPMFGFTESFNLSVSAAICLNQLVTKLHQSDVDWQYSDCQKLMTKILWNAKMVNRGEIFLKNVLADR